MESFPLFTYGSTTYGGKVFGGFTNSASINGDKLATLQYFTLLAAQHRRIWAGMGMKSSNAKASQRDDINPMGSFLGPMAQTPADAAPVEMSSGDLETARLYDVRVSEIAARMFATCVQAVM
jgi:NAD(P)H dehydrogenase (quinone)